MIAPFTEMQKSTGDGHQNPPGIDQQHQIGFEEQTKQIRYSDRPMFHLGGFQNMITCFADGGKCVLGRHFEVERTLKAIEKHRVSRIYTHTMLSYI